MLLGGSNNTDLSPLSLCGRIGWSRTTGGRYCRLSEFGGIVPQQQRAPSRTHLSSLGERGRMAHVEAKGIAAQSIEFAEGCDD